MKIKIVPDMVEDDALVDCFLFCFIHCCMPGLRQVIKEWEQGKRRKERRKYGREEQEKIRGRGI